MRGKQVYYKLKTRHKQSCIEQSMTRKPNFYMALYLLLSDAEKVKQTNCKWNISVLCFFDKKMQAEKCEQKMRHKPNL